MLGKVELEGEQFSTFHIQQSNLQDFDDENGDSHAHNAIIFDENHIKHYLYDGRDEEHFRDGFGFLKIQERCVEHGVQSACNESYGKYR